MKVPLLYADSLKPFGSVELNPADLHGSVWRGTTYFRYLTNIESDLERNLFSSEKVLRSNVLVDVHRQRLTPVHP